MPGVRNSQLEALEALTTLGTSLYGKDSDP